MSSNKHKTFTTDEKFNVIQKIQRGAKIKYVSTEFSLPSTTMSTRWVQRDKILQQVNMRTEAG